MPNHRSGRGLSLDNLVKSGLAASFLATALFAGSAFAQAWPAKPIRLVIAVSGGGETAARAFAQEMSPSLGAPVVVDVQSGAGGGVGAQVVSKAPADG